MEILPESTSNKLYDSITMESAIICLANNQKFNFSKYILDNMVKHLEGFSGNVTPLFETMMVTTQEEVGKGSCLHTDSYFTPTNAQSSSFKSQKKKKPKRNQSQAAEVHSPSSEIPVEESILTPSNEPLPSGEDSI
nr:hypothetical protein [Tanacetum cinerariifolium]